MSEIYWWLFGLIALLLFVLGITLFLWMRRATPIEPDGHIDGNPYWIDEVWPATEDDYEDIENVLEGLKRK